MRVPTPHPLRLRGLALAITAIAAGPIFAQELTRAPQEAPGQETAPSADTSSEQDARELRRVLVLRNGQAVRAKTRLRDGQWEYKEGSQWGSLDARAIVRVSLEKDLLREMRKRAKALGDEPGDRVVFAAWLAESGLVTEALEQLDRVLLVAPHDRAALQLLASRRWIRMPSLSVPPEQLDAALSQLITFGAKSPRAGRELAILELSRYEDREALRAELMQQLGENSLRRRSFAAQALGRIYPSQEAKRLLMHAVLDSSDEVRRESSFALGASEEPGMILPVLRAMGSPHPRVRIQAAEALGNMGFAAAVEPLMSRLATVAAQGSGAPRVPHSNIAFIKQIAYIQDFDVEVATFQAVADPQVNVLIEGNVLDAAVQGTQHFAFAQESKVLRHSLGQLTGQNPGYSTRAWQSWWEENRSSWTKSALGSEVPAADGTTGI